MKYEYEIVARIIGHTNHVHSNGTVEANTPKEAIVKALADRYGEPNIVNPVASLTAHGWIDRENLEEQLADVADDDTCFCLVATGNTDYDYDVEVFPVSQ